MKDPEGYRERGGNVTWKPKQTVTPASNVTLDTVAKALNANSGHGIMATASNPVTETKDNVLDTDTLLGETDKGNVCWYKSYVTD